MNISSDVYPQKQAPPTGPSIADLTHKGPQAFSEGESAIFHRPTKVIGAELIGKRLRLTCETASFRNGTVQTHETRMAQMSELNEAADQAAVTLNIEITFWSARVFRIRTSETALSDAVPIFPEPSRNMLIGQPETEFSLQYDDHETTITLKTDLVSLEIDKILLTICARDNSGTVYWSQRRSDRFTSDIFGLSVAHYQGRVGYFESFSLTPQEAIFGLGERFDSVERTGRNVDFWNKDAIGTDGTRTYINVPFLFSTRGYGLFLNSAARTDWHIATRNAGTLGFAVEDRELDYFIIYGPTPAEILYHYSQLTGFAPLPPIWSFGLWMSRNSYESWEVVDAIAQELRARQIPTDVLHLDTYWFQQDWNCDLQFATDRFADPAGHIAALKQDGFRISLWQYNFVPPRADNKNFVEGMAQGYFAKNTDGGVFSYPVGTTGSWVDDAIIDFSNPAASHWYSEQIKALIRLGAAAIKTDFGEGIPEDAVFKNIDGAHFHNLYALVYNSVIADAIHEVSGEHIVWARSGTAGSQRYPIHWNGDSYCNWGDLAGTLRAALSLGMSGFPFFSHDIGGFIGRPTPELYIRWAQFGLFSSHARCHGAGNDNSREPWAFGEEAYHIFQRFDQLRYQLLPYIYQQAANATRTAKPLIRALLIDYPHDRNTWHLDSQYLFGDSLLVAPILQPLSETKNRAIYLPVGIWYDYWTKTPYKSSGEWLAQPVDLATIPVFVKAGSLIPYGAVRQSTNNEIGAIAKLEAYTGANGSLHYDDGVTRFQAMLHNRRVSVTEGQLFSIEVIGNR